MSTTSTNLTKPNKRVASSILGVIIMLFTEIMFFAGLISAYIVNRADVVDWPPLGQPRLPIASTLMNTLFLIASAFTLRMVLKQYQSQGKYKMWLGITIILGLLFVGLQGYEWVNLISYGLTTTSSLYGAYFYLIVGIHGLHALIGIVALLYLYRKIATKEMEASTISAYSLYWYFVVGVWPILYYLVYLS